MSRPQDSIIDDDEESCPLCIEEFDLTDKNFKPCPCGYQICQFCFNSLKNTYEKSTCPNCRRVYDEKTIQFKIPSKEDIVNDKENKARKQAATKRKEVEKREVETSNRRNLAGVRVKQQNLVYVIGLVPSVKDESTLLQTLRGPQYFGQYGEIDKIVVSKSKPGATSQGIGVYITYAMKESAALCIEVVDGSMNGDRVLRAQYGTTKYCSAYLRGESCNNKSCTFLHETGEEGHGTTLQNEPSLSKPAARPANPSQIPQAYSSVRPSQASPAIPASSQPMRRESSKDEANDRSNSIDTSALPSTASWANKDTPAQASHSRPGQTGGRSSTSPQVAHAAPPTKKTEESVQQGTSMPSQVPEPVKHSSTSRPQPSPENQQSRPSSSGSRSPRLEHGPSSLFDKLLTNINTPVFRFSFDEKAFSDDELAAIERCPIMIDPHGGAKRRLMREKEAERLRQQLQAQATSQRRADSAGTIPEEETVESGSLALGGEPEEGSRKFSTGSAIQRPNQSNASSSLNDQFSNLVMNNGSLTPQQRHELGLLSSANIQQAPGLGQPGQQSFGMGTFDDQRHGSFQSQQYDSAHGHARQSSRYSFANDSVKPNPAPRFPAQQQAGHTPQHFYPSGVQGPPPGLKSAGTPPISGGGMFAQGHGFTSNMNTGFGAAKDANVEMLMRGRSGTGPGHESKPPAPGFLNSLYGPYPATYQDPGLVKQKKKGKKHRHANTSSSGGGVVDLADPSVLQARMHQNAGGVGQGLFGGQNQVDRDFPPLARPTGPREKFPTTKSAFHSVQSSLDSPIRSSTPRVPPGLTLPHAHPAPLSAADTVTDKKGRETKASSHTHGPVTPALPILPIGHRASSPRQKHKETSQTSKTEQGDKDFLTPRSCNNSITVDGAGNAVAAISTETPDLKQGLPKRPPTQVKELSKELTASGSAPKSDKTRNSENLPSSDGEILSQASQVKTSAALPSKPKLAVSPLKAKPLVLPQSLVATPITIESFPSTPPAVLRKSPDWTSASRPRTLRLTTTMTPKAETAPASAATERSNTLSAALLKQSSRQPSLSSISRSRPSTPTASEHGTSAEMSRAGSPPVSDTVGSAPERNKGKTQAKKERKAKTKMMNESRDEDSTVSTPPVSEEVGPIISRQKKKRRTQEKSNQVISETSSAGVAEPEPIVTPRIEKAIKVDSGKSTKKANSAAGTDKSVPEPEKPIDKSEMDKAKIDKNGPNKSVAKPYRSAPEPTSQKPYTLNDLFADAAKLPDTDSGLCQLLNGSISSTCTLLQQVFDSDEMDVNSAIFNPPPLSSYKLPQDSRKGAEYLDANGYTMTSPFGEIYLSGHDRKRLSYGEEIRQFDVSKPQNILKRTMIMPDGAIFRHLSAEDENRVIQLANRMQENLETYGMAGKGDLKPLDDMDLMNLTRGLEELMSFPVAHRISHLTAEPGTESAEDDDADFPGNASDETEEDEISAALASGFGAAPEGPTRKSISPNTTKRKGEAFAALNLRHLDVDQLQKRIRETQVEMEAARKEMEALEKKAVKKAKDVTRWREALLKEMGRSGGGL